ncbi:alcohol oxidase [Serendipita vermifera]|nr:alcohol oxidase [Serendipita vermifera]
MPLLTTSLFTNLGLFLAIGAQLTSGAVIPRGISTDPASFAATQFDFVVVGGGTAGLTVAARLAEKSWKVGVIEAGQYRPNDPLIDVPKNFGAALGNANYDWVYLTTPQANANNRMIAQNRGKVLGGSSAINFEIFNRPASTEYSAWSALLSGKGGWLWDSLFPYFLKSQTLFSPLPEDAFPDPTPTRKRRDEATEQGASIPAAFLDSAVSALNDTVLDVDTLLDAAGAADTLGTSSTTSDETATKRSILDTRADTSGTGPVKGSYNTWYSDVASPFIHTVLNTGVPLNDQPNFGNNIGIYNSARAVDPSTQTRSYAAPAYYAPNASKANLIVLTGAQATKINFGSSQGGVYAATGVSFSYNGATYTVKASKEVILSGGVFNTPQLLELSGIGNRDILRNFGIQTLVDLPGVGENLQDHQMTPCSFILKPGHHTWDELRTNATFAAQAAAQYQSSKTGILTSTISTLTFVPLQSFISTSKFLDVIGSLTSELLSNASSFSLMQWAQYVIQMGWLFNPTIPQVEFVFIPGFQPTPHSPTPAANTSYVLISPVIQHPFSRGSVHITTTDPLVKPAVDPNYLSSVFDRTVIVESIKYIRKLASTAPFSDVIQTFNDPPASSQSDDDFAAYARDALQSLKHPIGTAALGPRALGGVVDQNYLVYGTKNLRVVDASIFPMQISAHPQTTVYAIAEKAADLIKSIW